MQHFAYECPGLHGPGTRCDIRRQTLWEVIQSHPTTLSIPIMQRRYCWMDEQISQWWSDVQKAGGVNMAGPALQRSKTTPIRSVGLPGSPERVLRHRPGGEVAGWMSPQKRRRDDVGLAMTRGGGGSGAGVRSGVTGMEETGGHRTGKAIFRLTKDGKALLVVDGQQRITTTMLMCAALRDALLDCVERLGSGEDGERVRRECMEMVARLEEAMFSTSPCGSYEELRERVASLQVGDLFSPSRLVPSFSDRQTYFRLLCRNGLNFFEIDPFVDDGQSDQSSRMVAARRYFTRMSRHLTPYQLVSMVKGALDGMMIMSVTILTPNLNLCQVFQWLQENSIMSMGALLYNPAPGIRFDAMDLVRNLFLSHYVDCEAELQEKVYRSHWVPLEEMVGGDARRFDAFLDRYVELCGVAVGGVEGAVGAAKLLLPLPERPDSKLSIIEDDNGVGDISAQPVKRIADNTHKKRSPGPSLPPSLSSPALSLRSMGLSSSSRPSSVPAPVAFPGPSAHNLPYRFETSLATASPMPVFPSMQRTPAVSTFFLTQQAHSPSPTSITSASSFPTPPTSPPPTSESPTTSFPFTLPTPSMQRTSTTPTASSFFTTPTPPPLTRRSLTTVPLAPTPTAKSPIQILDMIAGLKMRGIGGDLESLEVYTRFLVVYYGRVEEGGEGEGKVSPIGMLMHMKEAMERIGW